MIEGRDEDRLPSTSGPEEEGAAGKTSAIPQVEGYEIMEPLGEGGMGTVWGAVQLGTRREVALKILRTGAFGSEKARIRFEREVEFTARLEHPNIARIYDSGLHQGMYYYAMELIEGMPLDKYVEEKNLAQRQILYLMRTVCLAVQHAHERGVIHRDLKPSNILVTSEGQPHVLDFGLAKALPKGDSVILKVSADGEAAGTPAFMSPEQAAGRMDQVDTRSDVYGLGVVLFRLLTGESPHDLSGTRYEVLRRIAEEEIRRPRDTSKDVDRELEALLLKALARDPKDRYASAGALAQDIENYLTDEPLRAKRPTTTYFLRKRVRKYWGRVAIACGVLAAFVGVALAAYVRVVRARDKATAAYELLRSTYVWGIPRGRDNLPDALDQAAKEAAGKFAGQPEIESTVRSAIGQLYLSISRFRDAEKQLSIALDKRRRLFGEKDPDTLFLMAKLAFVLWNRGEYDRAHDMYGQVLKGRQEVLGDTHPDTLLLMRNWAPLLEKDERLAQAEDLRREIVRRKRKLHGDEHPETLWAMNSLAVLLWRRGKFEQVEDLNRRILMTRQKAFGEEHPDTLAAMSNLAAILEERGEADEAEALRQKEIELKQRASGEGPTSSKPGAEVSHPHEDPTRTVASPDLLAFDGFDGGLSLDWRVLNPDATHYSLTSNPGMLTITAQDGDFSQTHADYENLFVIDCPGDPGEKLQLTTCLHSFSPVAEWNQAGLIFYEDDDNYIRFSYQSPIMGAVCAFHIGAETEGKLLSVNFLAPRKLEKVWLRVTKQGDRYMCSTSLDGKTFLAETNPAHDETGRFQRAAVWGDGSVAFVGLFANNGSSTGAPEIDASFDFFEVRALSGKVEAVEEKSSGHGGHMNVESQR